MNIYETFNDLRYHHENEVVEFKKAENNFDFDDLGKYFSALSNEANLRDKDFAWLDNIAHRVPLVAVLGYRC